MYFGLISEKKCLNCLSNTCAQTISDAVPAGSVSTDDKWVLAVQSIVTDLLDDITFNVSDNRFADEDRKKGNLVYILSLLYD